MKDSKFFRGVDLISNQFEGLLLDAYGVFWGGNAMGLYPCAKEVMEKLLLKGKIVGILSNSTQLASKEIDKLARHGLIQGKHFHFFLTSGEIARSTFIEKALPFKTPNNSFYVLGEPHPNFSSHEPLFAGTVYRETKNIHEADFIYVAIPHINGKDQEEVELFKEEISQLIDLNLPMVCSNPDHFANEGNPPRAVVRQGSLAFLYAKSGGEVFYIGKPYHKAYMTAMKEFEKYGLVDPFKILMIGDTPETDIRGANLFGMPSALLLQTGIMGIRVSNMGKENALRSLLPQDRPDYLLERFTDEL